MPMQNVYAEGILVSKFKDVSEFSEYFKKAFPVIFIVN